MVMQPGLWFKSLDGLRVGNICMTCERNHALSAPGVIVYHRFGSYEIQNNGETSLQVRSRCSPYIWKKKSGSYNIQEKRLISLRRVQAGGRRWRSLESSPSPCRAVGLTESCGPPNSVWRFQDSLRKTSFPADCNGPTPPSDGSPPHDKLKSCYQNKKKDDYLAVLPFSMGIVHSVALSVSSRWRICSYFRPFEVRVGIWADSLELVKLRKERQVLGIFAIDLEEWLPYQTNWVLYEVMIL